MPLVSVVVPTHNRPEMLAEALASVRAQTFTDYEIIVVSNGEGNRWRLSAAVAEKYGARFHALDAGNVSGARNYGVHLAEGEWIAFLDDDDLWQPGKLARQLAEARRTGADAIIADFQVLYPNTSTSIGMTRPPANRSIREGFLLANYGGGAASGIMARKAKLIEAGLFDANLRAAEDWDMWARLAEVAEIAYIPDLLSVYRIHASNFTHSHLRIAWGEFLVYRKNLRRAPPHLRTRIILAMLTRPLLIPVYLKLNRNFWLLLRCLYRGRASLNLRNHYWRFRAWLRPRSRYWAFRAWLRPRTRLLRASEIDNVASPGPP